MNKILFLMILVSFIPATVMANIYSSDGQFYIQGFGEKNPIFMVNDLAQKGLISKIKLYGAGRVHLISFAKKGEKEKLYSVDSSGFIYAIHPFSNYSVSSTHDDGHFQFREHPHRKYHISSKGYFLY